MPFSRGPGRFQDYCRLRRYRSLVGDWILSSLSNRRRVASSNPTFVVNSAFKSNAPIDCRDIAYNGETRVCCELLEDIQSTGMLAYICNAFLNDD